MTHLAKVVAVEVDPAPGTEAVAARGVRRLRDAGHEVVYLGAVPAGEDLPRSLAAVCGQEDADAVLLYGQVPETLASRIRDEVAAPRGAEEAGEEAGEEVLVLTDGPDLAERLAAHVRA